MAMQTVSATALEVGAALQTSVDVVSINFEFGGLVVNLYSSGDRPAAVVRFDEIVGYRVLDEGDLLEYWPVCSQANGWLYLIQSNGWFDNELKRSGFLREKQGYIQEYFVAGQNTCVSILSGVAPVVEVFDCTDP